MEADLIAISNHQSLSPVQRDGPHNHIVPGSIGTVPDCPTAAVRDELPEVISV
jgi:hypothetical protein